MALFGIVIEVKEEQEVNAHSPIVVTLFVMITDGKEEHSQNASFPIVVTLFGIVMEVREEHPENALSPIVVIPSEMMTVASLLLISFGLIFIFPVPVNVSDVKEEHP